MAPTAVITGASSGIGAATARRLAKDGYQVALVARRAERLAELADELGGESVVCDITDPEATQKALGRLDACDVLVNNAGGALGAESVASADAADWQSMFSVNVLGTLHVTRTLLPLLRRSPSGGTIVTVTSTAAFTNYEGGAGYSAAKHAEHALTETLRLELCGTTTRVIEIAPGMVRTDEFALNRFHGDAEKAAAVYAGVDRPLLAEDVAECVALAVGLPQHVNVDQLVVRPVAQAAQHKVHRDRLFTS
ncbi:SDR family NAD(P)-dependent oxidoreductase [Streptomyces alkaliterrae]|uniref:SDR family NAD(P)-dependent oxidoreductase n=1 Tax=Streptomyces alkaliterrae TaxID=2213162 RepID=A0A5P0YVL1_9ACTN|nr:SDR family NAD(P)-dependent oxidoreductase [Streptomyces alkaliterrae]MBB1253721.1 SDR family NAD(P)-dependent oxidoreductase [Streptomyces alkaliterrae]MBB1257981.1 SDR family NAD(P)-dependent oxidoreductase [Streptomyces alkaliterrae]MQS04321.1 SDR family NAD(P)-dependent oxidoreductase [Streptomyces alkaliterrae]